MTEVCRESYTHTDPRFALSLSYVFPSASQLRVGENRLTVTGDKGYCMVRATHSMCE